MKVLIQILINMSGTFRLQNSDSSVFQQFSYLVSTDLSNYLTQQATQTPTVLLIYVCSHISSVCVRVCFKWLFCVSCWFCLNKASATVAKNRKYDRGPHKAPPICLHGAVQGVSLWKTWGRTTCDAIFRWTSSCPACWQVVLAVKEVCSITESISTATRFTKCSRHHGDIRTFKNIGKLKPSQVRLKVISKLFGFIS